MLTLTVRVGQAVQIGEAAVVKVEDKSGRNVRLCIATSLSPLKLLPDGIIPQRFTTGITGERKRVHFPVAAHG